MVSLLALWLWVLLAAGSEVTIVGVEMGELFAALYGYYRTRSAGTVTVRNNFQEDLHVEVSVRVEGYAPEPMTVAASLPAGGTVKVPLRVDFRADELPADGGPFALEAEVEVRAFSGGLKVCCRRVRKGFKLHNLHTLPHGPPEALAAFVDPEDRSVVEFAAGAEPHGGLEAARTLFEAMRREGITCVRGTTGTVFYPRELLRAKVGSACSCAFLYAALLEGSGVPVALVVSGGRVLVLVRQGTAEPGRAIIWKGEPWVPVDVGMLKEGFSEAVAEGMRAYGTSQAEPFALRDAWTRYRPVKFFHPRSVEEIKLGITYARCGKLDMAERTFRRHLEGELRAAAYNNLGNVYLCRHKLGEAEDFYFKALEADPDDGAIYLNLGVAYTVAGEEGRAEAMFDSAFCRLGSYVQMCYALGISLGGPDRGGIRSLLREAEERALNYRTVPLGTLGAGPRGTDDIPLYWKRR